MLIDFHRIPAKIKSKPPGWILVHVRCVRPICIATHRGRSQCTPQYTRTATPSHLFFVCLFCLTVAVIALLLLLLGRLSSWLISQNTCDGCALRRAGQEVFRQEVLDAGFELVAEPSLPVGSRPKCVASPSSRFSNRSMLTV